MREALAADFTFDTVADTELKDADGGLTEKALHRLGDGALIESVLMHYPARAGSRERHTLCISSQAGCAVGCPFCATGELGFGRDLEVAEIVDQVRFASRRLVADGKRLTFLDYSVGQKSSWPLSRTPLGPLLSGSPDFNGKAEILPSNDKRVVVARAKSAGQYGQLTLAFLRNASAPGGLQLYGWTAIDPQNNRTTVKLSNVRFNTGVPDSAFTYDEPKKKR
jgi:hypothetical protein